MSSSGWKAETKGEVVKVKIMGERQWYFSSLVKWPININSHNLSALLSNVAFFNHICLLELNFLALNTLLCGVFEPQTDCYPLGGSLQDVLLENAKRGQYFPEAKLKEILLQVSMGLKYIHNSGLVHLDIKPSKCSTLPMPSENCLFHALWPCWQTSYSALKGRGFCSGKWMCPVDF